MIWNGEERRRSPRVVFPCRIIVASPIRLLNTHTENVSEGGIRVLLEEKLGVYTIVGLEIFINREKPIKCKGRVRWVVEKVNPLEREPLLFDTGIEFVEINDCDRKYLSELVNHLLSKKQNRE